MQSLFFSASLCLRGEFAFVVNESIMVTAMPIFGHKPDCWLRGLVCPRRYRAMLPALVRANLFAGD